MPQYQYVDTPNIGSALGKFGSGFLEQFGASREKSREEDALQQLLSNIDPNAPIEDQLPQILGASGINFEKKAKISQLFSEADRRTKETQYKDKMAKKAEETAELSRKKYDLQLRKLDRDERAAYHKETDPIKVALGSLDSMDEKRKGGNLGLSSVGKYINPLGQTAKDVGGYEIAAKSLISSVSNITIRNEREFKAMADRLTSPYISDQEADGIIQEMRRRLSEELDLKNQQFSGYEGPGNTMASNPQMAEAVTESVKAVPDEILSVLPDPVLIPEGRSATAPDGTKYKVMDGKWVRI